MAKKKTEKPAAGKPEEKAPEKKPAAKKPAAKKAGKYVGEELKVKLPSGAEFEGLCTGERKTNDGAQVFLKLKGQVSRYFNVEDIVK